MNFSELPSDLRDAIAEQSKAALALQGTENIQRIQDEICSLQTFSDSCIFRYQRRLRLDTLDKISKLRDELKSAKSGKPFLDFKRKIGPLLRSFRRSKLAVSRQDAKPQTLAYYEKCSDDRDLVLEMKRKLIGKAKRSELQRALLGDFCDDCGVMMLVIVSDSLLGCPKCAKTRSLPHASAQSSMESEFVSNSTVKIKSRLLEWVQFSQAKESGELDATVLKQLTSLVTKNHFSSLLQEDILRQIYDEIEKGPFLDSRDAVSRLPKIPHLENLLKSLNGSMTKKCMQILVNRGNAKIRKLYESAPKYCAAISGYWPRRFNQEQEERIRRMFTLAAPVYHSDKSDTVSTLAFKGGYPYWLRCICILNGWYEFLGHFQIKKEAQSSAREKKRKELWKILNWEYVPCYLPLKPQVCLNEETGETFEIMPSDFEIISQDIEDEEDCMKDTTKVKDTTKDPTQETTKKFTEDTTKYTEDTTKNITIEKNNAMTEYSQAEGVCGKKRKLSEGGSDSE